MVEGAGRHTFLAAAKPQIDLIRNSLGSQNLTNSLLADAILAADTIKNLATDSSTGFFRSIAERLQLVLLRHAEAETFPDQLELEMVGLAADWLAQLAILYREELPEPKSLISELLYAFDLIDSCHGAVLQVGAGQYPLSDPFLDDPDFDVNDRMVSPRSDPFAEDPGFGLEFDLLQRTVNFVVETTKLEKDPFGDDPMVEVETGLNSETAPEVEVLPHDFFADDPLLPDGSS